jgi:hypothetical protein
VAGNCECGDEPSGFIKCGEFLESLRTGQLLKKDSSPCSMRKKDIFLFSCGKCYCE